MYPSTGLQTALNKMREMSVDQGSIYHQYVPVVTDSTTIGEFGAPIIDSQNLNVLNDFIGLLKKVVYTAVYNKTFTKPCKYVGRKQFLLPFKVKVIHDRKRGPP